MLAELAARARSLVRSVRSFTHEHTSINERIRSAQAHSPPARFARFARSSEWPPSALPAACTGSRHGPRTSQVKPAAKKPAAKKGVALAEAVAAAAVAEDSDSEGGFDEGASDSDKENP